MRISLRHKHDHLAVDVYPERGGYRVVVDEQEHRVEMRYLDEATVLLLLDERCYRVAIARRGRERWVAVHGEVYGFAPESSAPATHQIGTVASPHISAPMPGKVLQVFVQPADRVSAGDPLLILEAMKMETRLLAEAAATVQEVRVGAGDMVDGGQVLLILAYDPVDPEMPTGT